jgi:predicted TPR repeat methyltransferase
MTLMGGQDTIECVTGAAAKTSGISPTFLTLLAAEPLADLTVLDVGTGWGRLAFELASRCHRIIGIDREPSLIEDARRRAAEAGIANAEFVVADAETGEYHVFTPQMVVAHLCMSDAIAERASRALAPGHVFGFVAFETEQWRETGRRSRFSYDEARVRALLDACGFAIEHLEVDRETQRYDSLEAALAAVVGLEERWRSDGRWFRYIKYLEEGGRTLTRSHLIVKARRR